MEISARKIQKILEKALIDDGEMCQRLYEFELEESIDEFTQSMIRDNDDFIFAVTVHKNDVTLQYATAMILIDKEGELYVNEKARDWLQRIWEKQYVVHMKKLLPPFSKQLHSDVLPINGVKTAFTA